MAKSLLPILALSMASVLPAALALPRPDISAAVAQADFLDVGANVNMGNLSFPDLECAFQEQAACVSHGGVDDTDSNGGDESGDAIWPTKSINDFQLDPSFQIRVNSTSCDGGDNTTQIFDALAEMRQAVFNATTVLLQDPLAENNRLYWGSPSTGDLSTPIGVLGQVLYSSKNDVSITCEEDTKQECGDAAKAGGAYVDKDSGTIHLCGSVFAGESPRKSIEDVCQDGRTLSDNKPLDFWSPLLLKQFLDLPQITHNSLLRSPAESYADVLHAARIDAVASTHNIPTYLYFLLDNFAQQQTPGGCRGEEEKSISEHKKIEPTR